MSMNSKKVAPPEALMTVAEAAETLRISEYWTRKLIRDGTIRAVKIGHRSVRVSPRELQTFIALHAR